MKARWVFTWRGEGDVKTPKARFCVLGFQDPRLATVETTSPTMTQDAGHLILQWLVNEGHVMHSGDLKTTFLTGNADLDRTGENAIYMLPPADLAKWLTLGPDEAVRLRKAVYGLVDAPCRWYLRLSRALRQAGFIPILTDSCVWILPSKDSVKAKSPTLGSWHRTSVTVSASSLLESSPTWPASTTSMEAATSHPRHFGHARRRPARRR